MPRVFVIYSVVYAVPGAKKLPGLIAVCCWARRFSQPLLALAKLNDIFTLLAPSAVDHIQGIESEGVPSSVQSAALICNASSVLNLERCCFLQLQTDAQGRSDNQSQEPKFLHRGRISSSWALGLFLAEHWLCAVSSELGTPFPPSTSCCLAIIDSPPF